MCADSSRIFLILQEFTKKKKKKNLQQKNDLIILDYLTPLNYAQSIRMDAKSRISLVQAMFVFTPSCL